MITIINTNEEGGKTLAEGLARLGVGSRDFQLFMIKLRHEQARLMKYLSVVAGDTELRQTQGATQVLDDIIEAADSARDLL